MTTALATASKNEIITKVENRIEQMALSNELHFPEDYSPQNALKAAWLILQKTKDRSDRPVLQACTQDSVANSLLEMVTFGFNPNKKHCSFIAYGTELVCQREYFGAIMLAKRSDRRIEDIFYDVVYKGDEFKTRKLLGRTEIVDHISDLKNHNKDNIIAAYAVAVHHDGKQDAEIMTIEQIKQAWKQSKMKPVDDKGVVKKGSTHEKFAEEMAKKTVVNRLSKRIVNSSDDSDLMINLYNGDIRLTIAEPVAVEALPEPANVDEVTGEIIEAEDPAAADDIEF